MDKLKRYGPLIPFLFSLGLQISPWHSIPLAIALMCIAALLALLIYWPVIRRIRLRTPIFLSSEQATKKQQTEVRPGPIPVPHRPRPRLEHDGVLWEDSGKRYMSGRIAADGPLCPKDFCPLGLRHGDGHEEATADSHGNEFISKNYSYALLFCPECKATYTLGPRAKSLKQSHEEVQSRFEGLRKRESNT